MKSIFLELTDDEYAALINKLELTIINSLEFADGHFKYPEVSGVATRYGELMQAIKDKIQKAGEGQ